MKCKFTKFILFIALILSVQSVLAQTGAFTFQGKLTDATSTQPTAFTYQGKLTDGGMPANGTYDFQFTLYDAANVNLGSAEGALMVTNGIFTASIDGAAPLFTSSNPARFLEIDVRLSGGGSYTTLAPRQAISSSPYSIKSLTAASSETLSVSCVSCVADSQISSVSAGKITGVLSSSQGGTGSSTQNFVDLTTNQIIGGNKTISGTFSGNGAGLTNLNGASLALGSVNAAQLGALSVTSTALGDGAVLTNKISDGAVTTGKLGDGSVTMPKIVDASVTTAKIGDGSVTAPKLADGAITHTKLAPDFKNGFDPQKVAMMRWDQLPVVPRRADVGRMPSALAFDGTFMYVANKLDNNVMRIRTSTGLIEGDPIPVGNAPAALVYDGFRSIWVANSGAGTVSRISISTAAVDMTITVGYSPITLAFDGTLIYVAYSDKNLVTRITKGGAVVSNITVGHKSVSLVSDGTFVYVTEPLNLSTGIEGSLRRIRASSGAVEGALSNVIGGALAFDGTFVYVANGSEIPRIRASTFVRESDPVLTVDSGINVTSTPEAICFDGTSLFISGYTYNNPNLYPKVIRTNISGLGIENGLIPAQGDRVYALAFDGIHVYAAVSRSLGGTTAVNGYVMRFQ